jgi:hypothetical protein
MRYAVVFLAAAVGLGPSAEVAEVGPCNNLDRVSLLLGQTRSFSDGKIRVAHVDTDGEPVCCSSHLLVFIRARGSGASASQSVREPRRTIAVHWVSVSLDLSRARASYGPQRGLLLTVPYTLYDLNDKRGRPGTVHVRVDLRDTGSVVIER